MKYLRKFNESINPLFGKYKTLNSLIENLINYITENKLFSIVEMNVNELDDHSHFEFNYDSNQFYISEIITSSMYEFKNKIYEFKINDNVTYVEPEDKEEIFDMLLMYHKQYDSIVGYISYKLNLNKKDAKFKVEEFDVITKDGIDKISLQSLFDFYENDDDHKSILDSKEFNKWIGENLIKESNSDIESYLSELINVLKEDNFLLTNKVLIYQRTPINGVHGGYLFKLKYKNIRLEVNKFPAYFSLIGEYDGMSHHPKISPELNKSLYQSIMKAYINRYNISNIIMFNLDITKEEAIERIEEFDIIENSEVNLISLNSLFDYYNITFDLKDIISTFISRKIPYTKLDNKLFESVNNDDRLNEIINYINDNLIIYGCEFEDQIGISTSFEFNYNGDDIFIVYSRNIHSNAGTIIHINNKESIVTKKLDLSNVIKHYINRSKLVINIIASLIYKDLTESMERIEEFNIIKGDKVDLISLESLCNYYKTEFPKEYVIKYLTKYHIKYIE